MWLTSNLPYSFVPIRFYEIIPHQHLRDLNFSSSELRYLISGSTVIDLEDWKKHSIYEGYTASSPQVTWLWDILGEYSPDRLGAFLQFCPGTSRVPLEGFQSLVGSDGPRLFCVQRVRRVSCSRPEVLAPPRRREQRAEGNAWRAFLTPPLASGPDSD